MLLHVHYAIQTHTQRVNKGELNWELLLKIMIIFYKATEIQPVQNDQYMIETS